MRISDWSSDVCSSDLAKDVRAVMASLEGAVQGSVSKKGVGSFTLPGLLKITAVSVPAKPRRKGINPFTKEEQWFARSEERRVGKECVSTCRSRWSPYH